MMDNPVNPQPQFRSDFDHECDRLPGNGCTGLRFGLYATSTDSITGNTITDQAGGATGVLFDDVASYSQTLITGNTITAPLGRPATHRGIIFTQVEPNFTLYTPYSSTSNVINNAASGAMAFSIPAGTPGPLPQIPWKESHQRQTIVPPP